MFSCCCVNKKALKKEQQLKSEKSTAQADDEKKPNENKSLEKSPQKALAKDQISSPPMSEGRNDKSNSSEEEGNNLSGLIMSDGLVGERHRLISLKKVITNSILV